MLNYPDCPPEKIKHWGYIISAEEINVVGLDYAWNEAEERARRALGTWCKGYVKRNGKHIHGYWRILGNLTFKCEPAPEYYIPGSYYFLATLVPNAPRKRRLRPFVLLADFANIPTYGKIRA